MVTEPGHGTPAEPAPAWTRSYAEGVPAEVEVPRETGSDAPRATWKLNGTLRITTAENASRG